MVAVKNVFLFVVPALCVLVRRQASKITTDLNTIDADVRALTAAVQNFDGSGQKALACQQAQNKVDNDLKNGTTDANATPSPQSASSCNSFINYVNNVLAPDVQTGTDVLISKGPLFQKGGYNSTVCQGLKQNKSLADSFADAVIKLCPCCTAAGNAAKAKIDNTLQGGINAYCPS